jgi:hypothetical protein
MSKGPVVEFRCSSCGEVVFRSNMKTVMTLSTTSRVLAKRAYVKHESDQALLGKMCPFPEESLVHGFAGKVVQS